MYYPQQTLLEWGPTEVKPSSQYMSIDPQNYKEHFPNPNLKVSEGLDAPMISEEGAVVLIHYDIVHRAGWNKSKFNRYMFKFQFFRIEEPSHPTWNCTDTEWKTISKDDIGGNLSEETIKCMQPVCHSIWNWLCGKPQPEIDKNPDLKEACIKDLANDTEWKRFFSAYTLAQMGEVDILFSQLSHSDSQQRLNSVLALPSVPTSCHTLLLNYISKFIQEEAHKEKENEKRLFQGQAIMYILSELGKSAYETIPIITNFTKHWYSMSRLYAIEALGNLGCFDDSNVELVVSSLIAGLKDENDHVRFTSAWSLAKLGPKAAKAISGLVDVLNDPNRYVQGYAVLALKKIGTPEATEVLLNYLEVGRWCNSTTSKSMY